MASRKRTDYSGILERLALRERISAACSDYGDAIARSSAKDYSGPNVAAVINSATAEIELELEFALDLVAGIPPIGSADRALRIALDYLAAYAAGEVGYEEAGERIVDGIAEELGIDWYEPAADPVRALNTLLSDIGDVERSTRVAIERLNQLFGETRQEILKTRRRHGVERESVAGVSRRYDPIGEVEIDRWLRLKGLDDIARVEVGTDRAARGIASTGGETLSDWLDRTGKRGHLSRYDAETIAREILGVYEDSESESEATV